MSNVDIFSTLAKYNSAINENYLTEAFVYVINSILEKDSSACCELLNRLCVVENEFSFSPEDQITVTTQDTTETGRPDIKISTSDKLIYIEVKHDSPLGHNQIQRYKQALESSPAITKHVVLLTRFAINITKREEQPYKHIRWFQVFNWLSDLLEDTTNEVIKFLIHNFNKFLEGKQMSMQKVSWEYINGLPAFMNLLNMIELAIRGAGLSLYKAYPTAVAKESRGFYIENNRRWCGIIYDSHLEIVYQVSDVNEHDINKVKKPTYKFEDDKWGIYFYLPLEDYHFFSLSKDEQLELITSFIKTVHSEVKQMRIRTRRPVSTKDTTI